MQQAQENAEQQINQHPKQDPNSKDAQGTFTPCVKIRPGGAAARRAVVIKLWSTKLRHLVIGSRLRLPETARPVTLGSIYMD